MLTDIVIANKSYTRLTVSEKEPLDTIALKVMRQDCPDFLLPVRLMEIDGETEIRYELSDGVYLAYLPGEVIKKDFILLLVNLLLPFKNCSDWFLDYHNLVLDKEHILVAKNGQIVRYVYIPTTTYINSDEAIREFFTGIILGMDVKDDQRCIVDTLRVIKDPNANLMTLLDYLQKESMLSRTSQEKEQEPPSGYAGTGNPLSGLSRQVGAVLESIQEHPVMQSIAKMEPEAALTAKTGTGISVKEDFSGREESEKQGVSAFGKKDERERMLESLYGESEKPEKEGKKKKEKIKDREKKQKSGSFLKLFKGKTKEEKAEEPLPIKVSEAPSPGILIRENESQRALVSDYRRENEGTFLDEADETMIVQDGDERRNNHIMRLRLESSTGCDCPEAVEIDLKNGAATVGRMAKNGEPQSDFNFDASVSFVSRRHFRSSRIRTRKSGRSLIWDRQTAPL